MKFSLSSIGILLVSVLSGVIFGLIDIDFFSTLAQHIAEIFSKLLKLIATPLLFFSVLSSFLSMSGLKEFRLIGRKLFLYTFLTTILAASTASVFYSFLFPSVIAENPIVGESQSTGFFEHFLQSIPDNLLAPFLEGNVFAIALLALAFGFSSLFLEEKKRNLLQKGCQAIFDLLISFTKGILFFLPLAMWAFTLILVKQWGEEEISSSIFLYITAIFLANFFQGFVILPLLLKWKKISPWRTFRNSIPALTTAFFTKSSNAALPISLDCAQRRLGIRAKVANFSLPLCSVINMNGCAAFILITLFFVSGNHGMTFTLFEKIGWIFIATFAAIGNAGVPMGCYFLSSALILSLGLPVEIMGLILPFYLILDMFETSLNVWSDICVTSSVQKDLDKTLAEPEQLQRATS